MFAFIKLVGPERAVQILGIRLVGINAVNATKLLVTLIVIVLVMLGLRFGEMLLAAVMRRFGNERALFWGRQLARLTAAVVTVLGIISIWFDDPVRLATALGLFSAGLAFALQKLITALAGYFIILHGKTFNVGDRIVMGGVRGDVIALHFTQTTIMEMGQPPPVQKDEPAVWVEARQYTGRIVTVSNARIFDEPVYNYSRHFAYLWEEIRIPLPYSADRVKAEQILLQAAERHTVQISQVSRQDLAAMQRHFLMKNADLQPHVYYRLTDNWLELTVRFIVEEAGMRDIKDKISREVLAAFDTAGIPIASATVAVVELPPIRLHQQ